MSQHDFDIANQTASNARADINDALQALASLSAGASAPATTYANMLWYDSSNNILKMRTEADDAWIDLGELDQINNLFKPANAVPIGAVNSFAMASAPNGWLECNGAAISRTTYAPLFSAIGTTFGAGDGSTTFNVPDLRGEFVRGWDNTRGVDTGRSFGSFQLDQLQNITGAFSKGYEGGTATGVFGKDGTATGAQGADFLANHQKYDFDASRVARAGDETRPRNIALLYCIKT